MGQFIETRDHTYRYLTLGFLSTLYVEVTSELRCQEEYIPFCLQGEFYKLKHSAFNDVLSFPPSLDLPWCRIP